MNDSNWKPLTQINKNSDILLLDTALENGYHCPMHAALSQFRVINGISTLVVGTSECTYYSRMVLNQDFMKSDTKDGATLHYTYLIEDNEVIFGCREGVRKALCTMKEEGARYVLILLTCVPALIGEDLEFDYDFEDLRTRTIDVAHFKRNGYLSGFHLSTEAVADFFTEKEETTKHHFSEKKQVNIWAEHELEEGGFQYLIEELKKQKFKIHILTSGMHVTDIQKAADGDLNLVFSYRFSGFSRKLFQKNKIPYISFFDVYDEETLFQRIHKMEEYLSIELGSVFTVMGDILSEERNKIHFYSKSDIFDQVFWFLNNPDIVSLSFLYALHLYGIEIKALHLEELDPVEEYWKETLLKDEISPLVGYGLQTNQDLFIETGDGEEKERILFRALPWNRQWFLTLQEKQGLDRILFLEQGIQELRRKGI